MPKKKPATQKPKPDSSQLALSAVERAIGGKLSDGMSGMGDLFELEQAMRAILLAQPDQTTTYQDLHVKILRQKLSKQFNGPVPSANDARNCAKQKSDWFKMLNYGKVQFVGPKDEN
jgi:hypothetical protein